MEMEEEILKVKEACAYLNISRSTLYKLIKTRQIAATYVNNHTKIRKHPRFKMSDLAAYMELNKIK